MPPQAPILSPTTVVFLIYFLSTKTYLSSCESLCIHKSFSSYYGEAFLLIFMISYGIFFLHIHHWWMRVCVVYFQLLRTMNEAGWVQPIIHPTVYLSNRHCFSLLGNRVLCAYSETGFQDTEMFIWWEEMSCEQTDNTLVWAPPRKCIWRQGIWVAYIGWEWRTG